MASLIRWDPVREIMGLRDGWDLFRVMDRFFDDTFFPMARPFGWPAWPLAYTDNLAVDMYETEKELVVKAVLPGFTSDDVDVEVTGDTLTIKAERKEERDERRYGWHLRERRYGAYRRSLRLPVEVKGKKAEATLKNGVLTVRLPKAKPSPIESIKIKVKDAIPKVKLPKLGRGK